MDYYLVDVAISLQQLILAATDMGLGTCWIGAFDEVKVKKALEIPENIVQKAIDHGMGERRLVEDDTLKGEKLVYLGSLYQAEEKLTQNIVALSTGVHPCPKIDVAKALTWVEGKTGLTLAPQQRLAVELAARSKVMVVTGGPGTGKTTIVNSILKIFTAKKLEVVLCAPTGRAFRSEERL